MLVLKTEETVEDIDTCLAPASNKGLVQIYTGEGKGKSSASLGAALRAAGHEMRVIFIRFVDGDASAQHTISTDHFPFEIAQLNEQSGHQRGDQHQIAAQTLSFAEDIINSGNYDMVILDEIFVAVSKRLITASQVLDLMSNKPDTVELVLTGPDAPEAVVQKADLVTRMVAVKHP